MPRDSLIRLYVDTLRDLYSAEQQILDALPKMIGRATHQGLIQDLRQHQDVTRHQIQRLDRVFQMLRESSKGPQCEGMHGIIREGERVMKEHGDSDVLDAAIIGAAQQVEHYEMAAYGCVRTWASLLGFADQMELLQQTLDEEGDMDHRLTALAESVVNLDAMKVGAGH